jgi:cob(I)alamin adenosyltransferase
MPTNFYTRSGDDGMTGLLGEGRISKADARIEALGAVDEVTAALGMARAVCRSAEAAECLVRIQRDLYGLMSEVAATPENAEKFRSISSEQINWLEAQTDYLSKLVEVPREFIVPGDSLAGAALDVARTIARRAERRLVALYELGLIMNPDVLPYMNRLSSFCFALELFENKLSGDQPITLAKGQD